MTLLCDDLGRVRLLTIDRPDRRNAVDLATITEIAEHVEGARADDNLRVVVLTGAGEHFCSGADLGGVEDRAFTDALGAALDGLRSPELVTMAAVDGVALGAGTQLAVSCDLRIATTDARFGVPAAKLGLAVDHETVRRLAQLAGDGTARAMLLASEVIGGEAAHRMGFVQRLGGLDGALAWAAEIARLAPLTTAAHKLALEQTPARADDPAVAEARRRAWSSADLQEGLAAFRERRPPDFHGV
jgi:enoyl-CoA hydratase